ncbi:MAG: 7-carboxy-7-deazaguanine synthase [Deltaproteobacteria bacterium]|nr:7-carboxy-7-deazaguanine synthase [Deltaproteobacteria bacterium]
MAYTVKEMFYSLQGEGAQAGRAAVFCRFAGCNLWSGREADRAKAICRVCDTDFVGDNGPGGGRFQTPQELALAVAAHWPPDPPEEHALSPGLNPRLVVLTGGEPSLQVDPPLVQALHQQGFRVALETNGTLPAPTGVDWVCVSPKTDAPLAQTSGDELKLLFPQQGLDPEHFSRLNFRHFFLQPIDSPQREENTRAAVAFCLAHPRWRLSLQTHKYLGIP